MYQFYFYVPESHLEKVKNAAFSAGAGGMGKYKKCCWQTKGEGQFCPLTGSKPFKGNVGMIEKVAEYKVEMICEERYLPAVIKALKTAHPYETPAFGIIKLENF